MPRRPQPRKRTSKKGRISTGKLAAEQSEEIGKWYYDNIAEESRHPAPELPSPILLWTCKFPDFQAAQDSTTIAWYRMTGSLPIVRRCFQVWQESKNMGAVHREALFAAIREGHHATAEVAAVIDSIPDSARERRKLYQQLADESNNADRSRRKQASLWTAVSPHTHLNPIISQMKLPTVLLIQSWIINGLWLCDIPTISGHLEVVLKRFRLETKVTERQVSDNIRELGLHSYQGRGRLILAARGPDPDRQLRGEMLEISGREPTTTEQSPPKSSSGPERVEPEPDN